MAEDCQEDSPGPPTSAAHNLKRNANGSSAGGGDLLITNGEGSQDDMEIEESGAHADEETVKENGVSGKENGAEGEEEEILTVLSQDSGQGGSDVCGARTTETEMEVENGEGSQDGVVVGVEKEPEPDKSKSDKGEEDSGSSASAAASAIVGMEVEEDKLKDLACDEIIGLEGEDDGEGGGIRIKDIGTLMEENLSDDEVVEVAARPRPKVKMVRAEEAEEKDSNLLLTCEDLEYPQGRQLEQYKATLKESRALKSKLRELFGMLKEKKTKGERGLSVRGQDGDKNRPGHSFSSLRTQAAAPTTIRPMSTMSSLRQPRPTIVAPNSTQFPIATATPGATTTQHLIFDPRSGLLVYPPSSGSPSTAMTASQQFAGLKGRQTLRAVAPPPQLLAALRNAVAVGSTRPLIVSSTPTAAPVQRFIRSSTPISVVPRAPASTVSVSYQNTPSRPTGRNITFPTKQVPRLTTRPQQPPNNVIAAPSTTGTTASQHLRSLTRIAPKSTTVGLSSPVFISSSITTTTNSASTAVSAKVTSSESTMPKVHTRPATPNKTVYAPPSTAAPVSASFRKTRPLSSQSQQNADALKQTDARTYPSLVVMVKPFLQEKLTKPATTAIRTDLDQKVRQILMQNALKFTEWLFQKGLLKIDHKCFTHKMPCKLALLPDGADKYPHSGGYVLTADCCKDQPMPVFQGSIFEASMYPPMTIMKLVYHWACQTPASNVLQWVKVSNYFLKNFYTLLRSVCVASVHEMIATMGGKGKYIEVGIVTLGTIPQNQNVSVKPTKVEILGVFDPGSKIIRMRLLNTTQGNDKHRSDRNSLTLATINKWINKESVVLIDNSLDKVQVEKLGFRNVSQSKAPSTGVPLKPTIPTNVNVMNYLKNIVPKMFQNTLGVLSKSLVQQFLDELSWREMWGSNPLKTFETIIVHLTEMTKADTGEPLIARLNRISMDPFAEWSYKTKARSIRTQSQQQSQSQMQPVFPKPTGSGIECLPDCITAQPLSELIASSVGSTDSTISTLVSTYLSRQETARQESLNSSMMNLAQRALTTPAASRQKRKADDSNESDLQKLLLEGMRTVTLQAYYYIYCPPSVDPPMSEFPSGVKCPLCPRMPKNSSETLSHLVNHVNTAGRLVHNPIGCKYCLKEFASQSLVDQHIVSTHKRTLEGNVCRICVDRFPTDNALILHMWKRHVSCEAPYRCEICEYRTSFHYDVVDHFYMVHGSTDVVQCPVCLKTFHIRSTTCLKNVVTHLQNHVLRKGKKCPDCCLSFSSDNEYRSHVMSDAAHDSKSHGNFVNHAIEGTPIRMPNPPKVDRELNVPPPQKKNRTRKSSGSNPSLQTLNTGFAVPLNSGDRYVLTPANIKITDLDYYPDASCWECSKPLCVPGHFRGCLKCSRCRYETFCVYAIQDHVKIHDSGSLDEKAFKRKMEFANEMGENSEVYECTGCYFVTGSTHRACAHLLASGHKACFPKKDVTPPSGSDPGPTSTST